MAALSELMTELMTEEKEEPVNATRFSNRDARPVFDIDIFNGVAELEIKDARAWLVAAYTDVLTRIMAHNHDDDEPRIDPLDFEDFAVYAATEVPDIPEGAEAISFRHWYADHVFFAARDHARKIFEAASKPEPVKAEPGKLLARLV